MPLATGPLRQTKSAGVGNWLLAGGLGVLVLLHAHMAMAATGAWVRGQHFQVRLLATRDGGAGSPAAAVEISLDPGWDTYWRTPGQGGLQPVFDFSRSVNLRDVAVRYPFPRRFDDGVTVANIYAGGVILPLDLALVDPSRPAVLALQLDVGVCREICVPARATASLELTPAATADRSVSSAIADAQRFVPGPPLPGVFSLEAVARTGGTEGRPTIEVRALVPDPARSTLFVEGPPDWFPGAPKPVRREGNVVIFSVAIDRLGSKTKLAGAALRFTLVSGERAIDQTLVID